MAEAFENKNKMHSVILENRNQVHISGVVQLDSFDEQTVMALTDLGELIISGENLHVNKLNLENGELFIDGTVDSFLYGKTRDKKGGFFTRLFQ